MRSNLLWLLLSVAIMLGVASVAQAEPQARDGTPAVVQDDGVMVAGLFRRLFDGDRCGPGGCPVPEPDVPDDPPPVKPEPKPEPKEKPPEPEPNLPTGLFIALAIVGGFVTLILIIKKERG